MSRRSLSLGRERRSSILNKSLKRETGMLCINNERQRFIGNIYKKSLIHVLVFLSDGFELKKKAKLRLVHESVQNKKRSPSGEFVVRHNQLNVV